MEIERGLNDISMVLGSSFVWINFLIMYKRINVFIYLDSMKMKDKRF